MYPSFNYIKIQPSNEKQHFDILQSYYVILTSYHGLASLGHEFLNITYNIIPFVSMLFSLTIVFYIVLPPLQSENVNIFIYKNEVKGDG